MDTDKSGARIRKMLKTLETICQPYGLVPEVITNIRSKYKTTLGKEVDPRSEYETDETKFDSRDVGFIIVLKGTSSTFAKIDMDKVESEIANSNLGIAKILIEFIS